jgi:4-amino-4-deoxy-L-arabinose transferase-like glycosyltransferase
MSLNHCFVQEGKRTDHKTIKRTACALQRFGDASSAGSRLRLAVKANRWRLALLAFIAVYAFLVLLNLGYMSFQWDEMPHLYGGLLLTRGQTHDYLVTYGYYPPLYDLLTTAYYRLFGVSAASGRLVAVTFSLLLIWIVFEFANRAYGPRIALLSSVVLGITPGFFWLSRVAMLDTMLMFFFSLTLFFFFTWIMKSQGEALILSFLALGVGFLAKYEVIVAGLVMIAVILLLERHKLKWRFSKFLLLLIIAILVVVPWLVVLYQTKGVTDFGQLLYVIGGGQQERTPYSTRFPAPVFYLIEMTWPFPDIPVHPVSLPIYILGFLGLGLWAYRRKTEDKFFLTWFIIVYIFFTLIPNKQWRYVTPVFPVLAISAANFVLFLYGKVSAWKPRQMSLGRYRFKKIAATLLIVLVAAVAVYSSYNAYQMTARDQIHIPIEETANYLASHMTLNESAAIVCAFNLLDQDMFRFYLPANMSQFQIWQYPELPVDAFTPNFNITEFVNLCEQRNVKYVILYDYGVYTRFFNTTLTYANVMDLLYTSGRFGFTGDEPFFGDMPYRTFLVGFHQR